MPTLNPNIIEQLMLLARNGSSVSPIEPVAPTQVGDYPDLLNQNGYPTGYDKVHPTTGRSWLGSGGVTDRDYNPETGYIYGSPGDLAVKAGQRKPGEPSMATRPVSQPNATGDEMPQPVAEKKDNTGYEDYLKIFQNTLPKEPTLDTNKRKQLATVAAINALGGMLKNVIDLQGGSKQGSPIAVRQDAATPVLLSQYEKMGDEYQQRKDRYDLMKTNSMQQALQYAYGDEKAREQYEKQLDLLNRSQQFQGAQTDKEIAAREKLAKTQAEQVSARDDKQYTQDLEKLKKNFEYESQLIAQRNNDALNALKEKYGMQQAAKTATELAKKSLVVTDEDPNKPITIPPQIYLDVLQKQIGLQNQDFTEFLTSTDFNATNNAGDIMVARYWKDFYTAVKDKDGNVVAFQPKGASYPSTSGASTTEPGTTPDWFKD